MNENIIHAFILKNRPKSAGTEQNDDPVQYPDGAVTMDEDCDHG